MAPIFANPIAVALPIPELAPVIRQSSKEYWETKNNIVFPEDFECTLDWNRRFAQEVLHWASPEQFHVYFCPITVDFVAYLKGIV